MQHFEKTREFTIKTDKAKTKLNEVLGCYKNKSIRYRNRFRRCWNEGLKPKYRSLCSRSIRKKMFFQKKNSRIFKEFIQKKQQQLDQKLNHEKAKLLTNKNAAEKQGL